MSAEPTKTEVSEEDASGKLGDIACNYFAIDACVSAFYDYHNSSDKRLRDRAYGLVMAIERLNDEIGRASGAI